jgi:hypothetical protein
MIIILFLYSGILLFWYSSYLTVILVLVLRSVVFLLKKCNKPNGRMK